MAEATKKTRKRRAPAKGKTPVKKAVQKKQTSLKDQSTKPGETLSGLVGHGALFGPPKTGKTGAACGPNSLLISWDPDGAATESLKGREDVYVVEPRTFEAAEDIIRKLHAGQSKDFDYVVFDSITYAMQVLGGKDILKTYMENRDIRRAYGKAGSMVCSLIHDLVQLTDVSVIFTAHIQKEEAQDDGMVDVDYTVGETEVKLAVTNMVWKILGPAVSWIGRTYKTEVRVKQAGNKKLVKQVKYGVSFNDGERSPAGSRLTMQGDYDNVLGEQVLNKIAADIKGDA